MDPASSPANDPTPGSVGDIPLRRVSLRHFIIVPTVAMALLIVLFRWLDYVLSPELAQSDLYLVLRTIVISGVMVSGVMRRV